jgi:hypothetical protein
MAPPGRRLTGDATMGKPFQLSSFTVLVAATAVAASAVHAQVYKWVDERGRVTYSSTPPPAGKGGQELKLQGGPSQQDAQAARERAEDVKRLNEQFADERRKRDEQTGAAATARPAETAPPVEQRSTYRDTDGVDYPAYGPPGVRPRPPIARPQPPAGSPRPTPRPAGPGGRD